MSEELEEAIKSIKPKRVNNSTTIAIGKKVRERLVDVKGDDSYNKFITKICDLIENKSLKIIDAAKIQAQMEEINKKLDLLFNKLNLHYEEITMPIINSPKEESDVQTQDEQN